MGNGLSRNNKHLYEEVNLIASNLILSENIENMKNLTNKDYCDKLLVTISRIFECHLSNKNIEYISSKILNDKIEIKSNNEKKLYSKIIAKYYVKIANLWYSILTTINPKTIYKNENNEIIKVEKYSQICDDMLKILNKRLLEKEFYMFNPKIIHNNNLYDDDVGIPELESLYYDLYDGNTGKLIGLSEKNKNIYRKDLETFYREFTGDILPKEINRFSEIPIGLHRKSKGCETYDNYLQDMKVYNNITQASSSNKLYKNYAEEIVNMIENSKKYKIVLINILDRLFLDDSFNNKIININLTIEELENLIKEAREILVKLYLNCEKSYIKIMDIYLAITKIHTPIQNSVFEYI